MTINLTQYISILLSKGERIMKQSKANNNLPMNWYSVFIYLIFIPIAINIVFGILQCTGLVYYARTILISFTALMANAVIFVINLIIYLINLTPLNIEAVDAITNGSLFLGGYENLLNPIQVYADHGLILRIIDIVYGLVLFAIGALGIITRQRFAKYDCDAPYYLFLYYMANIVAYIFYNICACYITNACPINGHVIVCVIAYFIVFGLNSKYFNRRRSSFCN